MTVSSGNGNQWGVGGWLQNLPGNTYQAGFRHGVLGGGCVQSVDNKRDRTADHGLQIIYSACDHWLQQKRKKSRSLKFSSSLEEKVSQRNFPAVKKAKHAATRVAEAQNSWGRMEDLKSFEQQMALSTFASRWKAGEQLILGIFPRM